MTAKEMATILVSLIAIVIASYLLFPSSTINIIRNLYPQNPYLTTTSTTTVLFPPRNVLTVIYVNTTQQSASFTVTNNTDVVITGEQNVVNIYVQDGSTVYLNITSDLNGVRVYGGRLVLQISGNRNDVTPESNTTLVSANVQGQGNVYKP